MERKTTSAGEFEEAIKNFSKISIEVDSLITAGNADAHRLMNKSIEDRKEAIANEATKRLKSIEMEHKKAKSYEAFRGHDAMEKIVVEEVKMEFDKGVDAERTRLRGNSATDVASKRVENKKSEDSDDDDDGSKEDSSEEESENESDEDEDSDDTETTEKDSSDEDDDEEEDGSGGEKSDDNDSTVENEGKVNEVDSNKK